MCLATRDSRDRESVSKRGRPPSSAWPAWPPPQPVRSGTKVLGGRPRDHRTKESSAPELLAPRIVEPTVEIPVETLSNSAIELEHLVRKPAQTLFLEWGPSRTCP